MLPLFLLPWLPHKVVEFLIQLGNECLEQHNFSGMMQVVLALEHSSIQRFKSVFEGISKQVSCPSVDRLHETLARLFFLREREREREREVRLPSLYR